MTIYRGKKPVLRYAGKRSAKALDSFTTVVEAHWSSTYRLLYHLTGSSHDAEDLTQETFLRALRHWERFQHGPHLRAWLQRIAANAFFDERRKKRRRNTGPLSEEVECLERSAEAAMQDREEADLIRIALQDLSDLARLVFHLRVTEDLSFKEIAELAGISEVASRQHMYKARQKLLRKLQGILVGVPADELA